ncbi:MAG: hypothetical protein HC926_05235 [Synechococcaceae cyanobacterium SM2_3_60]|nr:hypothetical protein [Synechococcaceae cyanobacterium SM2_3_60]
MQEFEGVVQFLDLAGGIWVLQAEEVCYALFRAPAAMLKEDLAVIVTGRIVEGMMSAAQVGPVLEVLTFVSQAVN